jgi:tRNA threonylcarbamoyl adenosine modification protein (Sua5/YciO/YrdC/YwlC family)
MTLKHRAYDSGKIFALMLADPAEITRYCIIPDQAMPLVAEHLPGALTIILPQLPSFTNPYYDHYHTIGIRVPDHDYMQRLLRSTGPLIATSANPRGEAPALTSSEVEQRLPDIDAVVDGAAGHQPPSTVIDATGDRLHTLRQGVIIVDN